MSLMIVVLILSFLPVIFWLVMEPIGVRFQSFNSTMTSLGQISGLVGMAMFAVNLILAGRLKTLDRFFKGLDKVYLRHHNLGALAFVLLLFHPLFLAVKYLAISARAALEFLLPSSRLAPNIGIIALFSMAALIVITFYLRLKYQHWKLSHKLMLLVFIFALVHTLLATSDVSRDLGLRIYIITLSVAGLLFGARQAFFSRWLAKKLSYEIGSVGRLNNEVFEISLRPKGSNKIDFKPGQFAFFKFYNPNLSAESHPFSFASSGQTDDVTIIIKDLGDYTSQLAELKVGNKVLIDGPYGNFWKNSSNPRQIWIAGGIGITPFLSMAQAINRDQKIDVYYSVKTEAEAIRLGWLRNFAQRGQSFRFKLWVTSKHGFINAKTIASTSGNLTNAEIYLCGPAGFMRSLTKQFVSLGVPIKNIHFERFDL